jgi:hypothetical protein
MPPATTFREQTQYLFALSRILSGPASKLKIRIPRNRCITHRLHNRKNAQNATPAHRRQDSQQTARIVNFPIRSTVPENAGKNRFLLPIT